MGGAMEHAAEPERCRTLVEVRAGIDTVDRELVALLARRFRYIDAAARIKTDRSAVRDEARKAEVLENVAAAAAAAGLDPRWIAGLWEGLVEASIGHELAEFDRLRAGEA